MASPRIRQRLLENKTLDLQAAYDQAYPLDLAQRNASFYSHMVPHVGHTAAVVTSDHALITDDHMKSRPTSESCEVTAGTQVLATTLSMKRKRFFCGGPYHIRAHCPAQDSICNKCGKKGHFAKACLSKSTYGGKSTTATVFDPSQSPVLAANAGTSFPQSLYRAATSATIKGRKLTALVDSCSDESYIDEYVAWKLKLPIHPTDKDVALAQKSLHTISPRYVNVDLTLHLNGETYPSTRLAFCRVPFGVTNGVAAFQLTMDNLVKEENLQGAFPYLDNITIAGHTQEKHDQNVQRFLEVINKRNLTLKATKIIKSVHTINILGYCVGNGVMKPDMERLQPLQEIPPPTSQGSLKRAIVEAQLMSHPMNAFFGFPRRSSSGSSLPSWLMLSGPVLLRKFVRTSKNELLPANPTYGNIRHPSGRESTVSLCDLAPCPRDNSVSENQELPSVSLSPEAIPSQSPVSPTTTNQEFPEGMGLHPEAEIRTEAA
ncbi:uncharacterized protein [Palaemon carinicauda]|uniref:uncharacterized protein n=1 Tax=Palaemon carinicauda TaxID=392227 RepID=UPI0035B68D99